MMKKNKNWLILIGGVMLPISLFLTIIFDLNPPYRNAQTDSSMPLFFKMFLVPLLFAPILEEIIFRGFLSKSKLIKILFFIMGFVSIFLLNFNEIILFFALLLYILYIMFIYTKNVHLLNLLILLSSIVFAIFHFSKEELVSLQTFPFLIGKFSLALILSWIVYNKSIFAGIIGHAVWNLIVILIFLHSLQFVDKKQVVFNLGESFMTYEKVPIFSSNVSSYKIEETQLIVKNMTIDNIIKYMDKNYLDTFNTTAPYMRYNIHVSVKSINDKEKLNSIVIRLLEKENMIIRRDSLSSTILGD